MSKPDCYKCKYRGQCVGDAHSQCNHPAFKEILDNPVGRLLSIFSSAGRVAPISVAIDECKVVGNKYGIQSGWFNHPYNFDPVWLESCTGFIAKED